MFGMFCATNAATGYPCCRLLSGWLQEKHYLIWGLLHYRCGWKTTNWLLRIPFDCLGLGLADIDQFSKS